MIAVSFDNNVFDIEKVQTFIEGLLSRVGTIIFKPMFHFSTFHVWYQ